MVAPAWSRPNGIKPLLLSSIMILSMKRCRQQPSHVSMSITRFQLICNPLKSWQLRPYLERAAGFSLLRQNADCRGTPTLIWAMSSFWQIACVLSDNLCAAGQPDTGAGCQNCFFDRRHQHQMQHQQAARRHRCWRHGGCSC